MADITIAWDCDNETLTASPSPFYAGPPGFGRSRVISWDTGSDIDSIQGITISTKNGGSYTGDQPAPVGASGNWQWTDPETATNTYEYIVSASVHDVGVKTLDPAIINRSG